MHHSWFRTTKRACFVSRQHKFGGRLDEGQATVELALMLPILVMFVLLFLQCMVVFVHRIELSSAAREAARVAVVDPSASNAVRAGRNATGLNPENLELRISGRTQPGGFVTVDATYTDTLRMPMTEAVLFRFQTHAKATMMVESP